MLYNKLENLGEFQKLNFLAPKGSREIDVTYLESLNDVFCVQ